VLTLKRIPHRRIQNVSFQVTGLALSPYDVTKGQQLSWLCNCAVTFHKLRACRLERWKRKSASHISSLCKPHLQSQSTTSPVSVSHISSLRPREKALVRVEHSFPSATSWANSSYDFEARTLSGHNTITKLYSKPYSCPSFLSVAERYHGALDGGSEGRWFWTGEGPHCWEEQGYGRQAEGNNY